MSDKDITLPVHVSELAKSKDAIYARIQASVGELMQGAQGYLVLTEDGRKAAKAKRAEIRAYLTSVNKDRIALKKSYTQELTEFEQHLKEILEPLEVVEQELKTSLVAYDEQMKQERYRELEAYYSDKYAHVADIVPFERISKHLSSGKYNLYSRSIDTYGAKIRLEKFLDELDKLETELNLLPFSDNDKHLIKSYLFEVFDLTQALELHRNYSEQLQERTEKQDALKRLELTKTDGASTYSKESKTTPQNALQDVIPDNELQTYVIAVNANQIGIKMVGLYLNENGFDAHARATRHLLTKDQQLTLLQIATDALN